MIWITITSICVSIISLTLLLRYKKDVTYVTAQIMKNKKEFTSLRMQTLNKDIEKLVIQINELYEQNQLVTNKLQANQEDLRHSIANISHDLRTPLTSIIGYTQLLKDDSLSIEEKQRYITVIEGRLVVLQQLITNFYELSRIESNEYAFTLCSLSLKDLLTQNLVLFYTDFTNKQVEPVVHIDEQARTIITDEQAVTRIFTNLLSNMLKYGQATLEISLEQRDRYIVTTFKNDAPSLTEEQVTHLFDRFYTADSSRSTGSTGLGLYIVQTLVERLGHQIDAQLHNGILSIKITWKNGH